MQQREKILLGAFAGVAVSWFAVWPFVESTFITPLTDKGAQVEKLTREKSDKDVDDLAQLKAIRRLKDYKQRSLPPNPLDAHRLYQGWLTDLCQICGFSDVKITLASRQEIEKTFFTVPVTIQATATTDQAVRFMTLFESADLLHRAASVQAVSPTNDGDPTLTLTVLAEGVALHDAPVRGRLFPQTMLVQAATSQGTELVIKPNKEFAAVPAPFLIRVGTEICRVTAANDDRWTVERGVFETVPGKHEAEATLELFPLRPMLPGEEDPREAAKRLVANRLFAKPAPPVTYKPKFAAIPTQKATRGTAYTYQLKVESWNPSHGKPVFALDATAPAGMTIESSTGAVKWTPAEDAKPGPVTVIASAASPTGKTDSLHVSFQVDVRPANHAPKFKPLGPVTVYLGRRATIDVAAEDSDLPDDRLTYAFEGNPPPGAQLDSRTGRIQWTAPPETELGTQTYTVSVKDNGDPPLSATLPMTVKFEDDAAAYTFLVGCLAEGEGQGEAMLHDRTTNQTLRLHPGDLIKRADLEAVILDVHPGDIVFASGSDVFRLPFGKQLREAERVRLPPVSGGAAAAANAPMPETPPPPTLPVKVEPETEKPVDQTAKAPAPAGNNTP